MERIHQISESSSWYIRQPNPDRQNEGYHQYKKGWEVRLVFDDLQKLELGRGLLAEIGFKLGRPFRKHTQWIQPLYGRVAVAQFLSEVQTDQI